MPDLSYKSFPFIFASKGIVARLVDDTTDPNQFLNLDNCEELEENSFGQRLGSTILNSSNGQVGGTVYPLSGTVKTIFKLGGLSGQFWRYAGTADGKLWRITGTGPGLFTQIYSGMSGNPFWAVAYTGSYSSQPYAFFADLNGMLKDNGTFTAPQQMGIFQPQYPVQAQSQAPPTSVTLDNYTGSSGSYTYTGISGGTIAGNVNTTTTSAITATGIQTVSVAAPTEIGLFQLLTIDSGGNQETVLVLLVTPTGFQANFTKTHSSGVAVTNQSLSVTVPASTTATVSKSFGGKPIPVSETVWGNQADYIGLYLFLSDPTQVQSITLKFDCGDGSYDSDYFYKVVAQGPLQTLISTATNSQDPTTALTDALLSDSLDLYGPDGIGELNTGLNNWTPLLFQLSDFQSAGRADFGDPVFNWANVNGYQIEIVMNDNSSATIQLACLVLFGGAGPDTLGGVAYDYRVTFFNDVDGTESNPCPAMSNVNPPNATNWVYPRRQPVLLNININAFGPAGPYYDPQITHLYIYRRGGTLGDNWRWIGQLAINIAAGGTVQFIDTSPDELIGGEDTLSLTNDVPVTSTLPVPVNTTLQTAITGTNQQINVFPVSMANISVRQLVTIGDPTNIANNFEEVIVLKVFSDHFVAFVQNSHAVGDPIQATASIGQPVSLMAEAYGQFWFAGDPQNPNDLYWSNSANPQYVSAAAYKPVSTADDIITAVVSIKGNLYVSTNKGGWWSVAPGSNENASPTIYPTTCKYGAVSPTGVVVTEQGVYYQAIDGERFFAGGASEYMTQEVEFLFQGVGSTPIVEADQTQLNKSVMAFWGNMVFNSYVGTDGLRHRLIWHSIYKRFRNDDFDAQSMYFEPDTKLLLVGDSNGLIHIDRQNLAYDQVNTGGVIAQGSITLNLQSGYLNQGSPANQKNYNNLQLDIDTGGQNVTVTLLFNDGQQSLSLGTVSTSGRQKFNLPIENGEGYQAYKVAVQLTGSFTSRVHIYQASIESLVLPMTRKAYDSYDLNLGNTGSKFARDIFLQYSANAPITVNVYYDDGPVPFTFTMPQAGGIRNPLRQRLPAISFRTIRVVATSTADFMLWQDSAIWHKFQNVGRGYQEGLFVAN